MAKCIKKQDKKKIIQDSCSNSDSDSDYDSDSNKKVIKKLEPKSKIAKSTQYNDLTKACLTLNVEEIIYALNQKITPDSTHIDCICKYIDKNEEYKNTEYDFCCKLISVSYENIDKVFNLFEQAGYVFTHDDAIRFANFRILVPLNKSLVITPDFLGKFTINWYNYKFDNRYYGYNCSESYIAEFPYYDKKYISLISDEDKKKILLLFFTKRNNRSVPGISECKKFIKLYGVKPDIDVLKFIVKNPGQHALVKYLMTEFNIIPDFECLSSCPSNNTQTNYIIDAMKDHYVKK
jgi:hypothetical protein